jgi:membrane protease YdiL (CAAX protease family)
MQLVAYLGRGSQSWVRENEALKTQIVGSAVKEKMIGASDLIESESKRSLQKHLDKVAVSRKTDAEAEALYLAYKFQLKQPITALDLAPLKVLAKARRELLTIYGPGKLNEKHARELGNTLPDLPYVYQAARVHALERAGVANAAEAVVQPWEVTATIASTLFLALGTVLGVFLWIIYAVMRANGKLQPLGHVAGGLALPDADRFAMRAFQILAATVCLEIVIGASVKSIHLNRHLAEIILVIATILVVPVLARVPVFGKLISLAMQGWNKEHLGKNILWGLAGAAANAPVLLILAALGTTIFRGLPEPMHPVTVELHNKRDILTVAAIMFSASIGAPILEETCFRGTLLPALSAVFRSPVAGIIVSSLLFAMMHPTGIPAWLPLAGIGATSALLTYQTRSLVPSIVMHAVHNTVTLLIALALA